MAVNQKDIKLLWGRSGNRCAICQSPLTQDKNAITASYTLGEQAHIVGEKEDAARGHSSLSADERDSYHNLILLCPTHHTEIDKNEKDWPVEKLHQKKSQHELWVMETLSESKDLNKLAHDTAITNIIDSAVEVCDLENWKTWTSWALAPDPRWHCDLPDKIFEFRQKVIAAIWPDGYEELRRSATTLSVLLNKAAQEFMKDCELRNDTFLPIKRYSSGGWNENYDRDLEQYNAWLDQCYFLIKEATKAANWFSDIVRRDINPTFFADKGKFIIMEGPFDDLSHRASLLEFTSNEKAALPKSLFSQKNRIRQPLQRPNTMKMCMRKTRTMRSF